MGYGCYITTHFFVGLCFDLCKPGNKNGEMKTIKEILDEMLDLTNELVSQASEPDEYIAVKDIEIDIGAARTVFERMKDING